MRRVGPDSYMNPYVAGMGLGLVLLATFTVMGRGLGASGAINTVVAVGVEVIAPDHAASNEFLNPYLDTGARPPLVRWIVIELLGVAIGGFISARLAGRVRHRIDRGPRLSVPQRLTFAFLGGVIMGIGMILARGCTSGQGLTGGALLNVGSWAFLLSIFAGAYGVAHSFRRLWT